MRKLKRRGICTFPDILIIAAVWAIGDNIFRECLE